jgi:hypothetical protein
MKTRRFWKYALIGFLVILVISAIIGLSGQSRSGEYGQTYDEYNRPAAVQATPAPGPTTMPMTDDYLEETEAHKRADSGYGGDYAMSPTESQVTVERMVIHSASMSIVVDDVEQTLPQVMDMIKAMEGYVVYSSAYRTYTDRLAATITLRVPSTRFNEAMAQLRGMAWKVSREELSGEDVTDQYVDLQSRLKTLQSTEEELLALLSEVRQSEGNAEEKASAILSIYNQLTSLRSEIEQIQGRMQYLEQMSAMATITVDITPREPDIEQPVVEEGFSPARIFRSAARDLVDILQSLLAGLIRFVTVVLPLLVIVGLVFGLPTWLIVRWRRRRRQVNPE